MFFDLLIENGTPIFKQFQLIVLIFKIAKQGRGNATRREYTLKDIIDLFFIFLLRSLTITNKISRDFFH